MLAQRRGRLHFLIDGGFERLEAHHQGIEQTVPAKQILIALGGHSCEFAQPRQFVLTKGALAVAGKVQTQTPRANGVQQTPRLGGQQHEHRTRRRFLQRLEQGVSGVLIEPIGGDQQGHLVATFHGLVVDQIMQDPRRAAGPAYNLPDLDLAQFGFRLHHHHIRMTSGHDLLAAHAGAAGIHRRPIRRGLRRLRTVQCLREG